LSPVGIVRLVLRAGPLVGGRWLLQLLEFEAIVKASVLFLLTIFPTVIWLIHVITVVSQLRQLDGSGLPPILKPGELILCGGLLPALILFDFRLSFLSLLLRLPPYVTAANEQADEKK
jgi:hypothetical protein